MLCGQRTIKKKSLAVTFKYLFTIWLHWSQLWYSNPPGVACGIWLPDQELNLGPLR